MAITVDPKEVEKFEKLSDEWWDESGKFKPLHMMNPVRLQYIKAKTIQHFSLSIRHDQFAGLRCLDIGCGGGLITEPIARLGGEVVGIDASSKNIEVAKIHAKQSKLKISYLHKAVEEMGPKFYGYFDLVFCLEIIEHVANPEDFIKHAARLLKPGGLMFISTINRTLSSFALAIVGAEYLLRWVPRGTHSWDKFLTIPEILTLIRKAGMNALDSKGMQFSPFKGEWALTDNKSVNYIMAVSPRSSVA